jgi:hypothetical protein
MVKLRLWRPRRMRVLLRSVRGHPTVHSVPVAYREDKICFLAIRGHRIGRLCPWRSRLDLSPKEGLLWARQVNRICLIVCRSDSVFPGAQKTLHRIHGPPYANTGFFYYKLTPGLDGLVERWRERSLLSESPQKEAYPNSKTNIYELFLTCISVSCSREEMIRAIRTAVAPRPEPHSW